MIQTVISKYGLAFHLALLTALPVALFPFLDAAALSAVMVWLSVWALLWLLAEPSLRRGEYHFQARARVVVHMLRDPFFYCLLVVFAAALVRACNSGVALAYDVETGAWSVRAPTLEYFPASAGHAGVLPLVVAGATLVVLMGIRHGLGLSARTSYQTLTSCLTGIGGLALSVLACCGVEPFLQKTMRGFADGPFVGSLFGAFLVLGVCACISCEKRKWRWARVPVILAIGGNAVAVAFFAPPLVALPYLVFAFVMAIVALAWQSHVSSLGVAARSGFFLAVGFGFLFLAWAFAPEPLKVFKISAADPKFAFSESYKAVYAILSRISREIWMDAPWSGAGDGAFVLRAPFLVEASEWSVLAAKPTAALCGYWTLLAERGIFGAVAIVAVMGFLLVGWVLRLAGGIACLKARSESSSFFFACPPVVWTAPFLTAFLFAEGAADSIFAMGVVPLVAAVPLALSAASFPKKKKEEKHRNG